MGLCFKPLWACVEAVGCICHLTQVVGGVVALCPVNHSVDIFDWCTRGFNLHLFSMAVAAFSYAACKSCCNPCFGLEIKFLQLCLNYDGFSIGKRTAKTFPYSPKSLPISHRICLCPQLINHFLNQRKGKAEALPGTLMRKGELKIYEGL